MAILKHVDFQVPGFGELPAGPQLLPGYRSAVLAGNPIGYWRLGEATGISAVDDNGAHPGVYKPNTGGAWTGGTLAVTGALGFDTDTAASFDGTAGFVEVPHHGDFNRAAAGKVALEAWVRFAGGASFTLLNYIIAKRTSGAANLSYWLAAGDVNGTTRFILNGAGTLSSALAGSTIVARNRWYHVVGVIDNTTGWIYVDGALDATGNVAAIADTLVPVAIAARSDGAGGGAFQLNGMVDDVAIYPALDSASIATHHRIGVGQ